MSFAPRIQAEDDLSVAGQDGRGSNQSGMRAYNERLVLSLIRQYGPMPKVAIAQVTGLSAQTVSIIMRALEADGLLLKGAPVRGKVGQPSVPLGLDPQGAFFFGLKVGRRSAELVLVDFLGETVFHATETYRHPTPDGVVGFARSAIAGGLSHLPAEHRPRVAGLGIALPFRLWEWGAVLGDASDALDAWLTRDIEAEIASEHTFPVFLCNDASTACGAELVLGDRDKPRDFLYFYIGFFAGGGLVLDNALYTGRSGNAAALGSTPIVASDGRLRQLVDVASLATLEQMLSARGIDAAAMWGRADGWSLPRDLLEVWLDQAAAGLAQAIVSATCLIDVDTAVIDGAIPPEVRAGLVARTVRCLRDRPVRGIEVPDVREGTIGAAARALGAASLPLSERFLVDRKVFLKG
ncbi:MAG: ROK family transcriptional regulator [Rhodobacteraceae bacterium]|nr:ROK family transcriptional regulator [Paracoccaceae bacterium]